MWLVPRFPCALPFPPCRPRAEVPVRPLALFLEARAGVALTQDLEGRPILGELFRDTGLGRDDGLREMLGLLVLRASHTLEDAEGDT